MSGRRIERNRWRPARPALVLAPVHDHRRRADENYAAEEQVHAGAGRRARTEAAAEVRREYPIINDERIDNYLDELGRRLVAEAPAELNQPAFEYSFTPVNLKDINAFALPGGPMFVNRGMFDAASTEGEVVGVMAHELAHVLLRHGTANATKAQGFQLGALAGAIAGAVIGGGWGEAIAQGSQFGLGTWLLKYSREYEKQADLLGAQLMARAGYDPRDLARMFETIQKEGNGAPPQWLSSHPNPGQSLAVHRAGSEPAADRAPRRRQRLRTGEAALCVAAAGQVAWRSSRRRAAPIVEKERRRWARSANRCRRLRDSIGRFVVDSCSRPACPRTGRAVASNTSIKYVPQNGYGELQGQTVLTHGVELGVARASSRDLRDATDTLIDSFIQGNPGMRVSGSSTTLRVSGRTGLGTPLSGRSALGGEERVGLYTTLLADGNLFYYVTVVPERDAGSLRRDVRSNRTVDSAERSLSGR